MKTGNSVSRRNLLRFSGGALAAPYLVPSTALGLDGGTPPSEVVRVGIIGLGGRARQIAGSCRGVPELKIAAVCDCFKPAYEGFLKGAGKGQDWKGYEDFRQMLEKEKLDGVMVETTTHARAWITVQAMQAGMDAYIEKPMCLTIAEGRAMVDAARKLNRVTQVGTQQRSIPLNNWASDLVKNGAIGKIRVVLAPNFVGPERWTDKEGQKMPGGGSDKWWDIWTNQAVLRPYHRALHHGWGRWWDYDGGGLCFGVTGWGTHSYDQIQRALGTDETGPTQILLEEPVRVAGTGKYITGPTVGEEAAGDTGARYYGLARHVKGPRARIRMWFDNGTELRLHLDGDRGPGLGAIFVGEDGKIEINRDKVAANPKELLKSPGNPGHLKVNENVPHIQNWVDCIKSRERCAADIEYGQRASSLCYLVNIARDVGRVGEKLQWDPKQERFTNCDEGNALLDRPRRKGYELPRV